MTDLILFAGQSNMAGRGEAEAAQKCPPSVGLEYRAVTAPDRLVPIEEPFGFAENRTGGIDDEDKKSGSLVSAFVNAYAAATGRNVVAVSASEGGTSTARWLEVLAADAADRLRAARVFLQKQGTVPAHILVVWCQGETDGDLDVSGEEYRQNFARIWAMLKQAGAEQCGLIQIGHFNYASYPTSRQGEDSLTVDARYEVIRRAQEQLCQELPDVTMVGSFAPCLALMKDHFHYHQQAYEEVGTQAGTAFGKMMQ